MIRTFGHIFLVKIQISLRIRKARFLHADNKDIIDCADAQDD